tara:strand:+ start:16313 stop:17092 length:780 start_codon:yes stop_codon:yes gene_type:complete
MTITEIQERELIDRTSHAEIRLASANVDGLRRNIVVKRVIAPNLAQSIERESRVLGYHRDRADIAHMHGYDLDKKELYLAAVGGHTVESHIAEEGPLSLCSAEPILRDMASSLAYLHSNTSKPNCVHYDVSDRNYLTDGRGAVLIDFGTSYEEGNFPKGYRESKIGTDEFMSPEKLRCEPEHGRESDIFGLGVVAYKVLVGLPPFWSSFGNLRDQILYRDPALPIISGNGQIDRVIMACLEKDWRNRPSAEEVMKDFKL